MSVNQNLLNVYHVSVMMLEFDLNAVLATTRGRASFFFFIIISILPKQKPKIIRIEQTDQGFEHRKLNSEPALLAIIMCCLLV